MVVGLIFPLLIATAPPFRAALFPMKVVSLTLQGDRLLSNDWIQEAKDNAPPWPTGVSGGGLFFNQDPPPHHHHDQDGN